MRSSLFPRIVVVLCVASCAAVAGAQLWTASPDVQTLDRNGDGRPDVWRRFDTRGQLTKIDVDSNFDGSPDIAEYYQHGKLVRRESDRNFNGQADLVEEFDPETHGPIRSVVDTDYDGTADLLVLFRDGRPVTLTRASFSAPSETSPSDRTLPTRWAGAPGLVPLANPFDSEVWFRATHSQPTAPGVVVGLPTAGGLPQSRAKSVVAPLVAVELAVRDSRPPVPFSRLPRSPRAPPLS